jgi:hypothetical protein
MKSKKPWFVSYQIPNESLSFVGPIIGSRQTARNIVQVLNKANPALSNVQVVEEQKPGSFMTSASDFMTITASQIQQAIHALGTVTDDRVGIIRQQMHNLQQLLQEVECIQRSLNCIQHKQR